MDASGLSIKPAEGKLAVMFVDDDDDDDPTPPNATDGPYSPDRDGILAIVQSVGDKVKIKAGQTIVCRPWAREGLKFGNVTIIDGYDVVATVGK